MNVAITDTAEDTLYNLKEESRERIISKLDDSKGHPGHYLDPLTNVPGYKLRVGDFRVIVDWDRPNDVLYVVAVLERKHDYRELPGLREVWGAWRE